MAQRKWRAARSTFPQKTILERTRFQAQNTLNVYVNMMYHVQVRKAEQLVVTVLQESQHRLLFYEKLLVFYQKCKPRPGTLLSL